MLYLSESDVKSLVNMSDVMDVVEKCFKAQGEGRAPNQPRRRVFLPKGTMHVMFGGMVDENEGYLGLKAYTTFPGIGVRFIFLLWDANTSEMLSLMEANVQGQMRTGAASGVAAKYMAREDAEVEAGLIGTGWQARSQLEALCCARDLKTVKVHSRRRREAGKIRQRDAGQGERGTRPGGIGERGREGFADRVHHHHGARTGIRRQRSGAGDDCHRGGFKPDHEPRGGR